MKIWFVTACLNAVCCAILLIAVLGGDPSLRIYGLGAICMAGLGIVHALHASAVERAHMEDAEAGDE